MFEEKIYLIKEIMFDFFLINFFKINNNYVWDEYL